MPRRTSQTGIETKRFPHPATRAVPDWLYGQPTLEAGNNGRVSWTQDLSVGSRRIAWAAKLDAGLQTGWNDYAKVIIPVNELPFTLLDSVRLQARYDAAVGADMAVTVYMHDPDNLDDFIELSHTPITNAGVGFRELNFPTEPSGSSWGWYGTVSGTPDTCPNDWDTSSYTWAQFQTDSIFSTWTIYRISIDYGYQTGDIMLNGGYLLQALINDVTIKLEPSLEEQMSLMWDRTANAQRTIPTWTFGAPVLRTGGEGRAGWLRAEGSVEGLLQKSPSGIIANLYGGDQTAGTGDVNWAAVYVPVNEMATPDFNSAQWTYRFADAEEHGHNIVIWLHDPADLGNRVEVTQAPSHADLARADGWNDHTLDITATQFFYFGEGVSGSGLNSGTQYTWEEFQADVVFSTWKIYRISIEYGWYSAGTFGETWLTDLMLNGQTILLQPGPGEVMGREVKSFVKTTSGDSTDDVTLVAPGSGRRIKVLSIRMVTASGTAADFECYFSVNNSMPAAKVIAVRNLDTDVVIEDFINFGETGPEGLVDEIVSMRTSVNITTNGTYTIVYREI